MNDAQKSLLASPMAQWLGLSADESERRLQLCFHERHIGNPMIRAIHGGVVEAFLELAAQWTVAGECDAAAPPATVNIDIDYLRSTRAADMHARARIARLGRRVAFVEATAWQQDEATPVAAARFRFRTTD